MALTSLQERDVKSQIISNYAYFYVLNKIATSNKYTAPWDCLSQSKHSK